MPKEIVKYQCEFCNDFESEDKHEVIEHEATHQTVTTTVMYVAQKETKGGRLISTPQPPDSIKMVFSASTQTRTCIATGQLIKQGEPAPANGVFIKEDDPINDSGTTSPVETGNVVIDYSVIDTIIDLPEGEEE